ncbi:class I SAM-dependent methyltransferase [Paenibacillus terrigena]|uniref:class I SAM-dependent methyltransferase n=1 Tax=Paenibacillus terrigena TaxID=369333 RepID=UPI0012EBC40B|nr:class I SAM-dependent methyltransferase [Paenibacillus terrigena]
MDKHYYGDLCSLYYDIDKPTAPSEELNYLLSFASKEMRILEPMCGSGRFIIPFVERGYPIDGFDVSKDMIARCRDKLRSMDSSSRIDLCDFAAFDSNREPYDLIFITAASFSLLTDRAVIDQALQMMKHSLKSSGRIVLSVITDLEYRNNSSSKVDEAKLESDAEHQSKKVRKGSIEVVLKGDSTYDADEQIQSSTLSYDLYVDGRYVHTEVEDINLRLYHPNELDDIVEQCGLQIDHKYTNFDKNQSDFLNADVILYELRK